MRIKKKHPSGILFATLFMFATLLTFGADNAHATLAAGTTISNTASVTYAESIDPVTSNTVDITVNLVSGLAWIDSTLTPVTLTVGNGGTVSYTVDLHNTGNGTTTATITDGTNQAASLGAGSWSITNNNPTLFATVSSAVGVFAAGTTAIPVSNLNTGALVAGTTRVMIGAVEFVVAAGSTATSLVVTGDATAVATGAGIQIGEVLTITFSGTAGTLVSPDLDENHLHSMTATDDVGGGLNSDGNPAATDSVSSDGNNGAGNPWYTRVVAGALTVDKYSRNVTDANMNLSGASSILYGGATYYKSGIKGETGDTLEYLVVINNAGPGSATDVTMTDAISTFLSLTTTSVDIDTDGNGAFDAADAVNNNLATYSAPTLTVYAGVGGDATTTLGGTITAAATKSAIRYRTVIQ